MAINHVLLLVTEVKPCWQKVPLGWVTFCEIGVVGFFSFFDFIHELKGSNVTMELPNSAAC